MLLKSALEEVGFFNFLFRFAMVVSVLVTKERKRWWFLDSMIMGIK